MIDLQKEIFDLLFKKPYMSLRQISNKVKIDPCFVISALAEMNAVRVCGKYFNAAKGEIENYYTVSDSDLTNLSELIAKEEKVSQVSKMTAELIKEIAANGNKNSVTEAYNIVKSNSTIKTTPNYFILEKKEILYCYEIALGKRTLAREETVRMNYLRILQVAA